MRTCSQEVLLEDTLAQYQNLCQRMQYLLSLQGSQIQVIWRLIFAANIYSLLKIFINGFCNWVAYIHQLERQQLQLYPYYHRPSDKNSILQADINSD